jgi:rhamnosyltransferase
MKIAGVVVLYNPIIFQVLDNIKSYINLLDVLYVFDNSENINFNQYELQSFSDKIKYITYNDNRGIAYALNYCSQNAYNNGYEWMLTMDQDSSFPLPNGFEKYIDSIKNHFNSKGVFFSPKFKGELPNSPQFYTSGALMSLNIWNKIGKFDEKLFIDEVDGDFTFRLLEFNYEIIKINSTELIHELGEKYTKSFIGKTLCSDNHSAIRKYYIARNRIYLMKKRPSMFYPYVVDSILKFIVLLIIEENKLLKIKMIFKGVFHGLINRMGKYKTN